MFGFFIKLTLFVHDYDWGIAFIQNLTFTNTTRRIYTYLKPYFYYKHLIKSIIFMYFFPHAMSRFTQIDSAYSIVKNYKCTTGNDSLRRVKLLNKPIFMIYVICTGASH